MAWGNKVTAQDLKEAGLDPDEIKTSLASLKDGTATKDDLTKVTSALDTITNSLKEMEGKLTAKSNGDGGNNTNNNGGNNSGGGNNTNNTSTEVDPLEFLNDPVKNTQAVVRQEIASTNSYVLQMGSNMAYKDAKTRFPLFNRFETEIKEVWDKYPLNFKGKPDELIENIYHMIVGKHAQELSTEAAKNGGSFNVIASGSNSGGGNQDNKPDPVAKAVKELTDKELKVAAGLQMTPEEYAKQKLEMTYV